MPTLNLLYGRSAASSLTYSRASRAACRPVRRPGTARCSRRRMWSSIRSPTSIPTLETAIDWERTLAFRDYLWGWGSASPRRWTRPSAAWGSTGLMRWNWCSVRRRPPRRRSAVIASGAGTDHLADTRRPDARRRHRSLPHAVRGDRSDRQPGHPHGEPGSGENGSRTRGLSKSLRQGARPIAAACHPSLAGRDVRSGARRLLAGTDDVATAMATALKVIDENTAKVDGIKISLLSAEREIEMRARSRKASSCSYGRRFQLPRPDRRRRRGLFPRAARHLRSDRAGRARPRLRRCAATTAPDTTR